MLQARHPDCCPGNPSARNAGAVMSTAVDLHNFYRVLFASPERIGLSQGERGVGRLQAAI